MKPKYNIMVSISCNNEYGVEMIQAVDERDFIRKYGFSERLDRRLRTAKFYDKHFTTEQFQTLRDFAQWVADNMENDSKVIQDTLEEKLRLVRQEQESVRKVANTKPDRHLRQLEEQEKATVELQLANLDVERDQMSIMDFLK